MMIVVNIRIDFQPGPVPGQLNAVVNLVTPDGTPIGTEGAQAVAVGKSLTVGPVQVLTGLPSRVVPTPPVTPGLETDQAAPILASRGR